MPEEFSMNFMAERFVHSDWAKFPTPGYLHASGKLNSERNFIAASDADQADLIPREHSHNEPQTIAPDRRRLEFRFFTVARICS